MHFKCSGYMDQKLTIHQKKNIVIACLSIGFVILNGKSFISDPIWRHPTHLLELSLNAGLTLLALVTLLRDFWVKRGSLELVDVSKPEAESRLHQRQDNVVPRIPVSEPTLKKAYLFCLDHSRSIRSLIFILIVFLLVGSIFDRHGHVVIENQAVGSGLNISHSVAVNWRQQVRNNYRRTSA